MLDQHHKSQLRGEKKRQKIFIHENFVQVK